MNSYYDRKELDEIGFASVGINVLVSRKCSIYNSEKISIGNNVRIDDFCILSGKIMLGNCIHIAAYCALYGGDAGIVMEDFSTISSRGAIYAKSDDYSGIFMTNPMVPTSYTNVIEKGVMIRKHVIIGTGCTILPGIEIKCGAAVGAMSLINENLGEWGIYAGAPCKKLKDRKQGLLELEKKYAETEDNE